jgi:DNA-binding Lrp family transcriptional regulator
VDKIDKELLNLLQEGLPLESRPFLVLSKKIGITEEEVIQRIEKLKAQRYLRRVGGIFNSNKLGYTSTLCAMSVPEKSLEETAKIVNSYDEITHNYIREHYYNMWFTIIAPSKERVNEIIKNIKDETLVKNIISLPATKVFKVKVALDIMKDV